MGRIGSLGCSFIFNPLTGEKNPAYENNMGYGQKQRRKKGYDAREQIDDPIKMRVDVINAPLNFDGYVHYGGEQEETDKDIEHRLTIRNNKTQYEATAPRRVEGLFLKQAIERPLINLIMPYEPDAMPMPLGEFNSEEQKYLRGDHIIDDIVINETNNDKGTKATLKRQSPYERDTEDTPLDFIDNNGGKYYTSLTDHHVANEQGSNVRADEFFKLNGGANQPVGDRTFESLFNQQSGDKTVSMVNFKQQDNFKARQHLGLYSGQPTTTNPKTNNEDMIQQSIERNLRSRHRRNSESDEYNKAEQEYKLAEQKLNHLRSKLRG